MTLPTNSRTADKFVVRLPEGMRKRISEVAAENNRSMNSEILSRLEETFALDEQDTAELTSVTSIQSWTPVIGMAVVDKKTNNLVGIIEDLFIVFTEPNEGGLFATLRNGHGTQIPVETMQPYIVK